MKNYSVSQRGAQRFLVSSTWHRIGDKILEIMRVNIRSDTSQYLKESCVTVMLCLGLSFLKYFSSLGWLALKGREERRKIMKRKQ